MLFMVVSDWPTSPTGKTYLKEFTEFGTPWTLPFEDDAARMPLAMARRAAARVADWYGPCWLEAVN